MKNENINVENSKSQDIAPKKKMKKGLKALIITSSIIGFIFVFLLTINLIPPKKVIDFNPFISTSGLPMLCAHRGGGVSNPENTLKAFKSSVNEMDVDILETDLYMTKDNNLVVNHDESINRTSDVEEITNSSEEYLIKGHTLEELSFFNYGYNFEDENGNYPYRDLVSFDDPLRKEIIKENDLSIINFDTLLSSFYETNKDLLFIIEIKDAGETGYKAADMINDLLTNKYPEYQNRVIIGTFHPEIEDYLASTYPNLLRGASTSGAAKFVITSMLGVNLFDFDDLAAMMFPTSMYGVDLTWEYYISEAHERNMAVQYWTINDEETMRELIEKKCDAIMTDNPKLLKSVLDSYR